MATLSFCQFNETQIPLSDLRIDEVADSFSSPDADYRLLLRNVEEMANRVRPFQEKFFPYFRHLLGHAPAASESEQRSLRACYEDLRKLLIVFRLIKRLGGFVRLPAYHMALIGDVLRAQEEIVEDFELFAGDISALDVMKAAQPVLARDWLSKVESGAWDQELSAKS